MNRKNIILILSLSLILAFSSCKRSGSVPDEEPKEEPEEVLDRSEPPPPGGCTPFGASTGTVPSSPYQDPIWHPSGRIIGFNQIPLREIQYHKGYACPFHATYIDKIDSIGFWLVNADGTNKRRILPYQLTNPTWSPDGKWIAFSRESQIYKMPFDGEKFNTSAMVRLTNAGRNFFPAWSPDGEWIAYDSNSESSTGNYRIWIMDKNGDFKKYIADLGTRMPTWTNNFEIIHVRYVSAEAGGSGLYKMNSDGQNVIKLVDNVGDKKYPIANFNRIAFIASNITPSDRTQLYILDSNDGSITKVTENGAINFSWGPDNKIVYVSFNSERVDETTGTLWTMNVDGTDKKPLTYNSMKLTRYQYLNKQSREKAILRCLKEML